MIYMFAFVLLSILIHVPLLKWGAGNVHVAALVLGGALLSVLVYQVAAYVDLGHLDPFVAIAAALQLGVSLIIGTVLALIFKWRRGANGAGTA